MLGDSDPNRARVYSGGGSNVSELTKKALASHSHPPNVPDLPRFGFPIAVPAKNNVDPAAIR